MSENALIKIDESAITALDNVASEAHAQLEKASGAFSRTLVMAAAVKQLSAALTDEIMGEVIALQNTRLGFRTDKPAGYPVADVRRCCVEAIMRGVSLVGNEFNIIAGNVYITKEGMERLVGEYPGLTDLILNPGVPRMANGGALVDYAATWNLFGKFTGLERTIPIRVNQGMGADAILGKATRKMLAAIYQQLTGSKSSFPEGDVEDTTVDVASKPAAGNTTQAKRLLSAMGGGGKEGTTKAKDAEPEPKPPHASEERRNEYIGMVGEAASVADLNTLRGQVEDDDVLTDDHRAAILRAIEDERGAIKSTRGERSNGQ